MSCFKKKEKKKLVKKGVGMIPEAGTNLVQYTVVTTYHVMVKIETNDITSVKRFCTSYQFTQKIFLILRNRNKFQVSFSLETSTMMICLQYFVFFDCQILTSNADKNKNNL